LKIETTNDFWGIWGRRSFQSGLGGRVKGSKGLVGGVEKTLINAERTGANVEILWVRKKELRPGFQSKKRNAGQLKGQEDRQSFWAGGTKSNNWIRTYDCSRTWKVEDAKKLGFIEKCESPHYTQEEKKEAWSHRRKGL